MVKWMIITTTCFLLFSVSVRSQNDIRKPPNMIKPGRPDTLYYYEKTRVVINCQAGGIPKPTYKWFRDGQAILPGPYISYDSISGDLTFPTFTDREEGEFQCLASNVFDNGQGGTITAASFSPPLTLKQIRVDRFKPGPDLTEEKNEYEYIKFPCRNQGKLVASGIKYHWYRVNQQQLDKDNGRLFIDQEGSLHFSYVLQKDRTTTRDTLYACAYASAQNATGIMLSTDDVISLTVNPVTNPVTIKPRLQYSNSGLTVLRFSQARLECFFSGYDPFQPIPDTSWYDDAGNPITNSSKYRLSGDGRVLTVLDVRFEDEKNYYCEGKNSGGATGKKDVSLNVTSAPFFLNRGDSPQDVTVSEGKDVVFNCDAKSAPNETPPDAPIWYINGLKTGPHTDLTKYVIGDNNKILTVKSVKKATDILCVQCQVKNPEGTTWGQACLNVILPITLTAVPAAKQEIEKGDLVDLTITATSDPSQTLSYRWTINNVTYVGAEHPPYMFYDDTTKKAYINTSQLSDDEFDTIGGIYRRDIFHPIESKTVEVEVILKFKPLPPSPVTAASVDMWLIGLIIGLLFLIFVIIIIIFIICRKQQEGAYNVDKKEAGAGLDPEKELKEKGFHDYSRPDPDSFEYPDRPRGELDYDDVPIGEDADNLGDSADEDDPLFNEDGSFIGAYQKKQAPTANTAESRI